MSIIKENIREDLLSLYEKNKKLKTLIKRSTIKK